MPSTADSTLIIRRAGAADAQVLARLGALDSAAAPGADSLIAELDRGTRAFTRRPRAGQHVRA